MGPLDEWMLEALKRQVPIDLLDKLMEVIRTKYRLVKENHLVSVEDLDDSTNPNYRVNKSIIIDIMLKHSSPMTAPEIAKSLVEIKPIRSINGFNGVRTSVSSLLQRYRNEVFVRVGPGLWDLRDRESYVPPDPKDVKYGLCGVHKLINSSGPLENDVSHEN